MAVEVITPTRAELEQRRQDILQRLGKTREEFAALAETHSLAGDEWQAQSELEEIAFLLGDDC